MRIESGATSDERIRVLVFFLMCLAFAGWFAYDGLVRYPAKNLDWALQALPEKPPAPQINPRATVADLKQLKAGMGYQHIESMLGEPALRQDRGLVYIGPGAAATIRVRDGAVTAVSSEVAGKHKTDAPNYLVRPEKIERIKPGMTEAQVADELGKPTKIELEKLWYIGPGAYAAIAMDDGKIYQETDPAARNPDIREAHEPSESDIFWQKAIAAGLAIGSILIGRRLYRILTLRVVLDDEGLHHNRLLVRWDQMESLATEQYLDKGWVDLVYRPNGQPRRLRLDGYRVNRFKEIVAEICNRKGFSLPEPSTAAQ